MNIVSWDSFVGNSLPTVDRAATVGVFDGLHLGHKALIDRILTFDKTLSPSIFTFRENPKAILRPRDFDGNIFSLDQKLDALENAGGGSSLCSFDFSGEFR